MPEQSKPFEFTRMGRFEARYTEDARSLTIEVEAGGNPCLLIVYLSAAKQWSDGQPLAEGDRTRIQSNLESLDVGPFGKLDVC